METYKCETCGKRSWESICPACRTIPPPIYLDNLDSIRDSGGVLYCQACGERMDAIDDSQRGSGLVLKCAGCNSIRTQDRGFIPDPSVALVRDTDMNRGWIRTENIVCEDCHQRMRLYHRNTYPLPMREDHYSCDSCGRTRGHWHFFGLCTGGVGE